MSELDTQRLMVGGTFSWEPIPEGCLLYEETTGKLLTLNPTAEAILAHCDGELTGTEICRVLESELEIPVAVTRDLLTRLRAEGVIGPVP